MSLTHLRLNQIFDNNESVGYEVESPDFASDDTWIKLGTLHISKAEKKYKFAMSEFAAQNKLLPPELYGLSIARKQEFLKSKYLGYGWGAWSMCIHHWAISLMESNNYPAQYP